jgi:chemotaxis protein MotB
MAGRKKGGDGGGGHGAAWVVTFADLVALLMCFFAMIVSFSVQEQEQVAQMAGSIREAFGVQWVQRPAGMIEIDGVPLRKYVRSMGAVEDENPVDTEFATNRRDQYDKQGPEAETHKFEKAEDGKPRQFLSAAVAIRQALVSQPDVAELSQNVVVEETDEGLNIRLVDQVGRTMFDAGSNEPNETLRTILKTLAPVLSQLPNRLRITGHTSSDRELEPTGDAGWGLSTKRSLATAEVLEKSGLKTDHLESVVGKADTEPLFPNDPFLSANRRIEILLMHEAPPVPINLEH